MMRLCDSQSIAYHEDKNGRLDRGKDAVLPIAGSAVRLSAYRTAANQMAKSKRILFTLSPSSFVRSSNRVHLDRASKWLLI